MDSLGRVPGYIAPVPAAVILLSGGLDSTTALAVATSQGFDCHALTVRYGQLHAVELAAATRVAAALGARDHRVVAVDLAPLASSALTSPAIAVPKDRPLAEIGAPGDVPSTYVPARNTVLLALALAWAESIGARDLFVGVNVLDASGYPDCRPEFVRAFEALAQVATRAGGFRVHAPLIELTKAQIIALGRGLGVDYAMTHSCYDPQDGAACGRCDACVLRRKGFMEAGVPDPTRYAPAAQPSPSIG
jgi:7-cyano-7-deazaguanine synthase